MDDDINFAKELEWLGGVAFAILCVGVAWLLL